MREGSMGMRPITSEQQIGKNVISGEINKSEVSPESEIAIDLKGNNAADEWLVFVEEELGEFKGDAEIVREVIKKNAGQKKMDLREFTDLVGKSMSEISLIDMNILQKLEELNKTNKE